jgi:MFS family permease
MTSNLGSMVQMVGAGWLMATLSQSEQLVALVQSSNTMPTMFLSLIAGALADSFDRRSLIIVAQSFMLIVAAVLTIVTWTGAITPWSLLALSFLIGCGVALYIPSWQSSIGSIVPRDQIPPAVNLNSMAFNVTRSLGPAVGGFVVAAFGSVSAFFFNTLSYIPMILTVRGWEKAKPDGTMPRESIWSSMATGLRFVRMSPTHIAIMSRGFLFSVCAISVLALLPVIARDLLSGTSVTFGFLLGSFGFGAVLGSLVSGRLRARFSNETVARLVVFSFACAAVGISLSRTTWLTCLLLLPAGGTWLILLSMLNMSIQLLTPKWVMGRTLALYQTGNFGGMSIGGALWGGVAVWASPTIAILVSAGCLSLNLAFGLLRPLSQFAKADFEPLETFRDAEAFRDVDPSAGPVVVVIEYDILEKDAPAFLAAMQDRRRIRLRDGVREWSLARDLKDHNRWIERYLVPTWTEYLRHHTRRTRMDVDVIRRLKELDQGASFPRIRRYVERRSVSDLSAFDITADGTSPRKEDGPHY